MTQALPPPTSIRAERLESFSDEADLHALSEAAIAAVLDGGGFGWVRPPAVAVVEQYYRGLLLVPERDVIVGRLDGTIYGAAVLIKPSRNNEAQAHAAALVQHFVAPYARGYGLARAILLRTEERARAQGFAVLNLDVRDTQKGAISLYESQGFIRWGTHPDYARTKGAPIPGHFYYKLLKP